MKPVRKSIQWLLPTLLIILPGIVSALVMTSNEGMWPTTWPKELEELRKQARTIDVATGIQQHIYEIQITNREQFERVWPAILKVKTTNGLITIYRTNNPPPRSWGSLLTNGLPTVRIYAPTEGSLTAPGTSYPEPYTVDAVANLINDGKMLKAGPPWPATILATNGALPEYVKSQEVNGRLEWMPANLQEEMTNIQKRAGFVYRARIDLDLVADGKVIDPDRLQIPHGTTVNADGVVIPELSAAQRSALVSEASKAVGEYLQIDQKKREENEIPKKLWGPSIQSLKPLRVVEHRVNVKIVLAEGDGIESGFYVNIPISSYAPQGGHFLELVQLSQPEDKAFTLFRYKLVR